MTAAEILRKAATLPWTQGEIARDAAGNNCGYSARRARCWCALGALARTAAHSEFQELYKAERALEKAIGGNMVRWNDAKGRTASQVSAMMIEAAEFLERGQ